MKGYVKVRPLYGSTSALVVYDGPWPAAAIDMNAGVFLRADAAAAADWNAGQYEAFPLNQGSFDLGGTTARTGFARNMGTYDIFFTYGRAAYQLEMGFTLSSSASQRNAAVPFAQSFAKTFYANLRASQPAP